MTMEPWQSNIYSRAQEAAWRGKPALEVELVYGFDMPPPSKPDREHFVDWRAAIDEFWDSGLAFALVRVEGRSHTSINSSLLAAAREYYRKTGRRLRAVGVGGGSYLMRQEFHDAWSAQEPEDECGYPW
ncbi:MAG: hypothetical protein JW990_00155 [Thermoleophilia bacterium]|nr:hypothetical protein [Thermoleophilia bacterium]